MELSIEVYSIPGVVILKISLKTSSFKEFDSKVATLWKNVFYNYNIFGCILKLGKVHWIVNIRVLQVLCETQCNNWLKSQQLIQAYAGPWSVVLSTNKAGI